VNGFEAIAASLGDLAEWAEDSVAGGKPPMWVIQQSTERTRPIALLATLTGKGKLKSAGCCAATAATGRP
jgi:hypothetical protein